MTMEQALVQGLPHLGRTLTAKQVQTFCDFGSALLEKNQVMNLTAITQPEDVARMHFLDSMELLTLADFSEKAVIDVGCGAGFPGVPLKIADPSIRLTLLDSLKKRVDWLGAILPQLGIEAECVPARAEEYAVAHREAYDIAVSRAVARLSILTELCLPLVRVGGMFLSMKALDCDQELAEALPAIRKLAGTIAQVTEYTIPQTDTVRRAIVIRKESSTPSGYPRRYAKIKQSPIGSNTGR